MIKCHSLSSSGGEVPDEALHRRVRSPVGDQVQERGAGGRGPRHLRDLRPVSPPPGGPALHRDPRLGGRRAARLLHHRARLLQLHQTSLEHFPGWEIDKK